MGLCFVLFCCIGKGACGGGDGGGGEEALRNSVNKVWCGVVGLGQ